MKKIAVFLLCFLFLFMFSCSKKEPVVDLPEEEVIAPLPELEKEKEEEVPTLPEEPELPDETLTANSYLTGLPCTPEDVEIRPVAVVLNNFHDALPQVSIADADVVWECNAEGGITRLVAVYSDISKVGEIGAVRSARDYFIDVASIHSAILVHAGASPSFYSEVKRLGYDNIDGVNMHTIPSDTFWRDSVKRYERGYEHSLETSGEKLVQAFSSQNYDTTVVSQRSPFNFYNEPTYPEGETSELVTVCHSAYITTDFTYNSEDNKYYKRSFGKPHVEENTGEQLAFENVMLLYATHRVVDEDLRLDITLSGEGTGTLYTAGRAVDFNWSRTGKTGELVLKNSDGTPLMLNRGKTHITIFDKNAKNSVSAK